VGELTGTKYAWRDKNGIIFPFLRDSGAGGDAGTVPQELVKQECGVTNIGCQLAKLPGMLFAGIALLILMLAGGILTVAGTVFNWVVIRTVFQFGTYFGTSEGMLTAWGIMRDIANIGLLFGFIFMGVLLILNVDGGGHGHGGGMSAKKAIPRLIIFAVLLNFSLFASQAVIDISNAFSASFATLAGDQCDTVTSSGEGATGGQDVESCVNEGISGNIMAAAGLTKLFSIDAMGSGFNNLVDQPYQYTISLIMLSIFVLVTAMVLLAGAIMLIIRVVILSLLMVTSPIGFAGMVIPKLEGIANMWWSKLISQSFFAPVYLLLIFISIKLTEGLMQGNASLADAMIANQGNTVAGNMQVVMVFLIVIGFMIASLMAASKMGAMGAGFATGFAQKAVTYPFAVMGRSTIGAGSAKALKSYESAAGRARSSIKDIKNPIARFAATTALNTVDDAATGTLSGGKNMKFFGGKSYAEESKHREERGDHLDHEAAKAQAKTNLDAAIDSGVVDAIEIATQKMGDSDLRDYIKSSKKDLSTLARNLSPEKFANLMKDKDLSESKKHELSHERFHDWEGFEARISRAAAGAPREAEFKAVKDSIKLWSNDDITEFAKSSPDKFKALVQLDNNEGESLFTDDQREGLEKAKGLTNSQRQLVKDQSVVKRIDSHVKSGAPARLTKAAMMMGKIKKAKDRAKLDADTLVSPAIINSLVPADLPEIMNEAKLSDAQKNVIKAAIASGATPNLLALRTYLSHPRTNSLVSAYWS